MHTLNIDNNTEIKLNKLLKLSGLSFSKFINSMINYRINELKKGIRNLKFDFANFEHKYNMKSNEFYKQYINGDFGNESEKNDYMIWSGEYESYLEFKNELKELK